MIIMPYSFINDQKSAKKYKYKSHFNEILYLILLIKDFKLY